MKKKFFKYIIPSILSMWVYSLYTMVDGLFVAKGVGETALAAVNISMPFVNAAFAVSIAFAVGTSTIAAISLGKNETQKAREVFTMNGVLLLIIGLIVSIVVLINLETIAYFLGASEHTLSYVKEYLGFISAFTACAMLTYYLEVLVKIDRHPRLATVGVCISAVTNIVLDYLFVIKLQYGVKGAAIATGTAQFTAILLYMFHFLFKSKHIKFVKFKFDFNVVKRTLPIGASDFITELSTGLVIFMYNRIILAYIGEIGIISYTVIMYLNNLVLMTMAGISQGTQPLISFYYGKKDDKAYTYFLKNAVWTVVFVSLAIYAVCINFSENIVGIYINRNQTEIFEYAVYCLKVYSPVYLLMGFNHTLVGFYSAIEKPRYSISISICRILFIVVSLFLMVALLGSNGIWLSSFVSEMICLIMCIIIFVKFYYDDLFEDVPEKSTIKDLHS